MYPGQYPQPQQRRTDLQAPFISGYSTVRLYASLLAATTIPPTRLTGVSAVITNLQDKTVQLGFVPLDDRTTPILSGSGTRCELYSPAGGADLGKSIYVSGAAVVEVNFQTSKPYLEMFCEGGGPTNCRIQLESLIQWDQMAFDKSDTKYPVNQLTQPKWSAFPWPS